MTLRVVFGPTNVADQGPALAEAMRRAGVDATTYASVLHPFFPLADVQAAGSTRADALRAARQFYRLALQHDVVHLQSNGILPPVNQQLPPRIEAAYLRLAMAPIRRLRQEGRLIAITFHGSDIRPVAEIRERWHDAEAVLALPSHDAGLRARRIRYSRALARQADLLFVTTPDLLPLLPKAVLAPVVPSRAFSAMLLRAQPQPPPRPGGLLRVLHAPSNPTIKGSPHVTAGVARARELGASVELRTISGQGVDVVVAAMLDSDIVVDQLNFGWYSAVAVEAMSLGRPAVARTDPHYRWLFDSATRGAFADLGPIHSDAESLARVLSGLAALPDRQWQELVVKARRTYEQVHRPDAVARLVLDRYQEALAAARAPGGPIPST